MTLQPLQTKEDITHGFSIPDPPGIPPTPTAADYRALLVKHRKTQLQNISTNLQRMAEVYDHAAEAILERVRALPDTVDRNGTGWLKAQLNLSRQVREELERLRTDYATLLDMSMISSAQDAADREAEVARLVGAPADPRLYPTIDRAASLMNGNTVAVSFGSLAKEAVETVANRYYRDGLQLSQRLYRLSTETRQQVEDTILGGIADGSSARDLATRLQSVLSADGVQTPRYNAMRLARTEVNNAFRESVVKGVMDPSTGGMKSYVSGVKWNLSRSHARSGPDICCKAGTLIETDRGPLPIEDVQLGDCILTHRRRYRMVTRLYRNTIPAGSLVRLCFRVGRSRIHELTVTPNHPVLTDEGWVQAGDLRKGCRGRSLPSMLVEPYVQQNNGKTDRALSSSEQSLTSPLLQNSALGLCDALFRLVHDIQSKWGPDGTTPTCSLGFESGSDTELNRRSNLDYRRLVSKETVASELRQTAETSQVSDYRSLGSSRQIERECTSSNNTYECSSWIETLHRTLGMTNPWQSVSLEHYVGTVYADQERAGLDNKQASSTSSRDDTVAPQSRDCKSGKLGLRASFSRMRHIYGNRKPFEWSSFLRGIRILVSPILCRTPDSSSYIHYGMQSRELPEARLVKKQVEFTPGGVVYNLGVEDDNSYFAGGIAVHNCDLWAAHDEGIGAGVYQPEMVPVDHPHGLCFLTTVLTELPDVIPTTMTMKPDVNAVPKSQVEYYARQGDVPALAHLSRLNRV